MGLAFGNGGRSRNACRVERREAEQLWANLQGEGAPTRSAWGRGLWGLLAIAAGCAALGTAGGGIFAPAEIERMSIDGNAYTVNMMRALFFIMSATGGLACFAIWKASHRAGLGFWRSTARPALLCVCGALMGAGLTFANFFAMGPVQLFGLGATVIGAAGMLFFWILRGPPFALRTNDAYWGRALGLLFGLVAMVASVGSFSSFRHWSRQGYRFDLGGTKFGVEEAVRDRWNSRTREIVTEHASYRVPALSYSVTPLGSALLALLAVGCFSEMRYRRRLARVVRQGAFERVF